MKITALSLLVLVSSASAFATEFDKTRPHFEKCQARGGSFSIEHGGLGLHEISANYFYDLRLVNTQRKPVYNDLDLVGDQEVYTYETTRGNIEVTIWSHAPGSLPNQRSVDIRNKQGGRVLQGYCYLPRQ